MFELVLRWDGGEDITMWWCDSLDMAVILIDKLNRPKYDCYDRPLSSRYQAIVKNHHVNPPEIIGLN